MSLLVKIENLSVRFDVGKKGIFRKPKAQVQAVNNVTLDIHEGETLGLVGESGSGKTTLGRAVLRVIEPSEGRISFAKGEGEWVDLSHLSRKQLRKAWKDMQMIFQDPYSSLNPRMTVRDILAEPLIARKLAKGASVNEKVIEIASLCGISPDQLGRFPHAFSGGQRQRIAIARTLILEPKFIVCDEPISALDVSIQIQIINLLQDLQKRLNLTYLFIAHDLTAVAYISDRVAVMYLGEIVEIAPTSAIYYTPRHPYTEALLSAVPQADPDKAMHPLLLKGERPNPANPPSGCRFRTRCRFAQDLCSAQAPALQKDANGHYVACHFADDLDLKGALSYEDSQEKIDKGQDIKMILP